MDKEYTQILVFEQERIHDFSSDVLHQLLSNASEPSLETSYLSVSNHNVSAKRLSVLLHQNKLPLEPSSHLDDRHTELPQC
jgi:hypothetical protein